jgi:uncharacterized protein YjaZ
MNKILFTFLFCLLTFFVIAQTKKNAPLINLNTKDITPKFLSFYDTSIKQNASEENRWNLWKTMYDFAATPPTPQGDSIARKLLDQAWSRYPSIINLIKKGASVISAIAKKEFIEIADLLKPDSTINVTLLVYVGGFEGNAFTTAQNGKITTAIAIETRPSTLPLLMTHELTHAVHIGMGSFAGGWQRTIGTIIVTEGLAMRVTQKLFPTHPDKDFTDYSPGWLAQVTKHRIEILKNIQPFLFSDNMNDVMRFTMGKDSLGFERQAYYVGWIVVGYWLNHGMTFADIAHIHEKELALHVQKTIEILLKNSSN